MGAPKMTTLQKLIKEAIRYGMAPDEVDVDLTDEQAMLDFIGSAQGWDSPREMGITKADRETAKQAWAVMSAKPTITEFNRKHSQWLRARVVRQDDK